MQHLASACCQARIVYLSNSTRQFFRPQNFKYNYSSKMSLTSATKKRKIETENRAYQERWEKNYLITNNKGKLQCLVCLQIISVCKEYNVKRHYSTLHETKYKKYEGESRQALISDLRQKLFHQTSTVFKLSKTQDSALKASYAVSLQLAIGKKPFSDGEIVKKCAIEMAKAFGNEKLALDFESVPLSHQTVQRRVADMGEHLEKSLRKVIKNSHYFSICLDESTDQTDVSQLLIFIRSVQEDFSVHEELLNVCSFHGTSKGKDVYDEVKKSTDPIGGMGKCSAVVTDGAPAMVGKNTGLIGLLRTDGVDCPALHCIIHQEALCGESLKQLDTFKTVVKTINMVRGGNRSLLHRQLQTFLDEVDAEYGDLLLYNQVRWLSSGKCLERFFGVRKEIVQFLKEFVKANTADLEDEIQSTDFLKQLAFLTDLTRHLNELNLKLQGRHQCISDLVGHIDGFRNKLKLFISSLSKNNLTHFQSCSTLSEEAKEGNKPDFSEFVQILEDISQEFASRFADFETLRPHIALFSSPLDVPIEDQDSDIQMELCDLQGDPFLRARKERGPQFFALLGAQRFPKLRDLGLKMTSMFASTYACESTFSAMNLVKNSTRNRLSDLSLLHLLRLAQTKLAVDIPALVKEAERPQVSH